MNRLLDADPAGARSRSCGAGNAGATGAADRLRPVDRRHHCRAGSSSTDLSNYKRGSLLGEQLVKAVPQIKQIADVRVEQIVNVNSSDITLDNWLTLAKRIHAIIKETPAVAGFVITYGTNTLEETAYFLNLTIRSDKPVVLVGSMRPATAMSADGPLNLLNAVSTAICAGREGQGHVDRPERRDQRRARHHQDEHAAGRNLSGAGARHARLHRRRQGQLLSRHDEAAHGNTEFDVTALTHVPKVAILYSYIEPDAALIRAAVSGGAKGIVFAGHRQRRAVGFEETAPSRKSRRCRPHRGRRWFDRAASATAASSPRPSSTRWA